MQWERAQPLSLTDVGSVANLRGTWGSSLPVFLCPQPLEVLMGLRETKEPDPVRALCVPCTDRAGCPCPAARRACWSAGEFWR